MRSATLIALVALSGCADGVRVSFQDVVAGAFFLIMSLGFLAMMVGLIAIVALLVWLAIRMAKRRDVQP